MDMYSFELSGSDTLTNYVDLVYIYIQDFDWSSEYLTGHSSRFRSTFLTRKSTFTVYFCGASSCLGVAGSGRIISSCLVKDMLGELKFPIKVNNVAVGSVSIGKMRLSDEIAKSDNQKAYILSNTRGQLLKLYSYSFKYPQLDNIYENLLQGLRKYFECRFVNQNANITSSTETGLIGKDRILRLQKRRIEIIEKLQSSLPSFESETKGLQINDDISGKLSINKELTIKSSVLENRPDQIDLILPSVQQVFKVFSAFSINQVEDEVKQHILELEKDLKSFKALAKSFVTLETSTARVAELLQNTKNTVDKAIKSIQTIYVVCADRLGYQSAQAETLNSVLTKLNFLANKTLAYHSERRGHNNVSKLYSNITEAILLAERVLQIFDPIVIAPLFLKKEYLKLLSYAIGLINNSIHYWSDSTSRLEKFKTSIWPFFENYGFLFRVYYPGSYCCSAETIQMLKYTRIKFHPLASDPLIRVEMRNAYFFVSLPSAADFLDYAVDIRILPILIPYHGSSIIIPDKEILQVNRNTISLIKSLQKSVYPSYASAWWKDIENNEWLPITTITGEVRIIEKYITGTDLAMCGCCWLYHKHTPEFSPNEIDVMEITAKISVST